MGLKEELTSIKTTISDGVVANKVSKFAYTDTAYNENDVNGVATYDVTKEQNIPLGTPSVMKVNETVVTKGWRARASSITRMLMNHFLGRISYNLNKANDMINSMLSNIISYLGTANGIATLDTNGRIPYTQLPDSMVTLKGYWNASTNTPTLVDGTGTNGDEYIVDVAGSQDLGSGSQYFKVGDRVVYSSSVWRNIDSGSVKSVCNETPDQAGNVSLDKGDVGLENVVNTGDSATPVMGGTTKFTTGGAYFELAKKVSRTTTVNGHELTSNITITKEDVELGNVVNTGDSNIPVQNGITKFTTGGAYADKLATPAQNSTKNFTAGGAYADKLATPSRYSTKNFTAGGAYDLEQRLEDTASTIREEIRDLDTAKAPVRHDSALPTYGLADRGIYGHVRLTPYMTMGFHTEATNITLYDLGMRYVSVTSSCTVRNNSGITLDILKLKFSSTGQLQSESPSDTWYENNLAQGGTFTLSAGMYILWVIARTPVGSLATTSDF